MKFAHGEMVHTGKQDLKQIHDFVARDSKRYAQKVIMDIVDKSEALNLFPEMGTSIPELDDPSIRELSYL